MERFTGENPPSRPNFSKIILSTQESLTCGGMYPTGAYKEGEEANNPARNPVNVIFTPVAQNEKAGTCTFTMYCPYAIRVPKITGVMVTVCAPSGLQSGIENALPCIVANPPQVTLATKLPNQK